MKDLDGVRGWLLFYCIVPGSYGSLVAILDPAPVSRILGILQGLGTLFLCAYRAPWVRTYLLWYWGILLGLLCLYAISMITTNSATGEEVGFVIGSSVWFAYFLVSKRVKTTYRVSTYVETRV